MIQTLPAPAPHVVALRIGETVAGDDLDAVTRSIDSALATHDHLSLFLAFDDWTSITPAAVLKEVGLGLRHLGHLDRFERVAVLTDKKWLQTAAGLKGALIPGVEVRAFPLAERSDALDWITEHPEQPERGLVRIHSYESRMAETSGGVPVIG